jgi:nucleoside-diphosphate-sugar epimerase
MDSFLLTGATGVIGSAIVKRIVSNTTSITCPVRNIDKTSSMYEKGVASRVNWIETSLEDYLYEINDSFDYIIHCASPTASKYFVEQPVETMLFNTRTTTLLLEYCRKHTIKGMIYLSSIESYGSVMNDNVDITEDFQGYVNPMESRSSYNMAKRMCECLCHAYAEEYKVPVKVVRLTQTISPFINEDDMRVFAQFARHAAKGEDIELHTEGFSARQYIHIDDAVEAILCVLYKGVPGEVYNAAREDSYISARDMAQFVQENFNPSGKVVFHLRDDMGYAPITKLRLDTQKLRNLGWRCEKDLYEMFRDLIEKLSDRYATKDFHR